MMKHFLSRRRFLLATGGLGFAAFASSFQRSDLLQAGDGLKATGPIVDTHQHLWDLSKLRLPHLKNPKAKPLRRNFLLSDYNEATAKAHVEKTVYMEVDCDPKQKRIEADYVLNICRTPGSQMKGAVIGGVMHSDEFAAYIKEFAQNPYVKGVRTVLHNPDLPRGMCLERQFVDNVRLLGHLGLSFDLCMRPGELIDGVRLGEKCEQTRFIIDHCGNMDVQSADAKLRSAWEQAIKAAAARPNFVCKISGIVVTAKEDWKPSDLESVINFCLESFGEDRVFFGGDWPVCTLKSTYQQWVDALNWIVRNRTDAFRRKLFHDNAVRFYKLA
jgi:L-fuconolactonase